MSDNVKEIFKKIFIHPPKTTLYHYTSQKGFLGIINNESFWASNIFFLNDSTELNLSLNYINSLLGKLNIKCKDNQSQKVIREQITIEFLADIKYLINEAYLDDQYSQFYVISLTELEDTLSQWRGYCGENSGYSLGFDIQRSNFDKASDIGKKYKCNLGKCMYKPSEHEAILTLIIKWALNKLNELLDTIEDLEKYPFYIDSKIKIASEFLSMFFLIAPFLKEPAFKEEKEWRLVFNMSLNRNNDQIKFTEGKNTITPRLPINLNLLPPLTKLTIGPNPNQELNFYSTKKLLSSKNLDLTISKSKLPYRGNI